MDQLHYCLLGKSNRLMLIHILSTHLNIVISYKDIHQNTLDSMNNWHYLKLIENIFKNLFENQISLIAKNTTTLMYLNPSPNTLTIVRPPIEP